MLLFVSSFMFTRSKENPNFGLFLFSTEPDQIFDALAGGLTGVVVDREHRGKERRQAGFDTQINRNTLSDLIRLRSQTPEAHILCRISNSGNRELLVRDMEEALGAGADEILLPMVKTANEVEGAFSNLGTTGESKLGIMIETEQAVRSISDFSHLPLSRVYVGLNDLAIDRKSRNIFEALRDGTIDSVREQIEVPFGIAGLTLPNKGSPIPCRLLMAELARLRASFTFLRRSFLADTSGRNFGTACKAILDEMDLMFARPQHAIESDEQAFGRAVANAPDPIKWRIPANT